ncbi:MAG: hypothetical protein JO303_02830 [Caulobacteraceae bacterium]|nr:hypothetical protein [Caulobacteraceae bacterium]
MKPLRILTLAGAAAVVVGGAAMAAAAIKDMHVMTVRLPDGAVEQIRYSGDVAPVVRFAAPGPDAMLSPSAFFAADPAFAQLQRISEQMDRRMAAMMQGLSSGGPVLAPGLTQADLGRLPAGATRFTSVSTLSGSGVCTRSVEYTSAGDGKAPRIVSHVSGDCGPAAAPTAAQPAAVQPAAGPQAGMVKASYASGRAVGVEPPGVWN